MLKVGQKVVRTPSTIGSPSETAKMKLEVRPMKGEVIFVHSKGRFHTVEFTNAFGVKMRQCFDGVD